MAPRPFRLPEITYPLSINTIGKVLATGHEISITCHRCNRHRYINLVQLSYKLGMDHSSMAVDLKPHFYCPACREAGKPDRDIAFTLHVPTAPKSGWPTSGTSYDDLLAKWRK
jgi:hypothetical protein